MLVSLPSWERGLKLNISNKVTNKRVSLPSWERGLKRVRQRLNGHHTDVAPLVGAWIETRFKMITKRPTLSLPSWERGLKL